MTGVHGLYVALLSIGVGLAPAPTDSLEIRFVGNAGFQLSDGTTTLLIDLPYTPGAFGYMEYDPTELAPSGRTVSVITHRHADHFDAGLFEGSGWDIIGPEEVTNAFESSRVLDGRIAIVGNFRVQRFRTPHRDTEHYSYLIEWRGHRMYVVGDTESPQHVLGTEALDFLFITPWLACAVEAAGRQLPATQSILYHHTPSDLPDLCGEMLVMRQGSALTVQGPGS